MSNKPTIRKRIAAARAAWRGQPTDNESAVIKALFTAERQMQMQRKAGMLAWPGYRQGRPEWQLVDYASYVAEGFALNALVYGAIMYKARALSLPRLRVYTGNPDNPDVVDADEPLAQLTSRPNTHQSMTELTQQAIVYYNLSGNSYIHLDRGGTVDGPVEAMRGIRPDRIFIVPLTDLEGRATIAYLYVPEGRTAWMNWSHDLRRQRLEAGDCFPIVPADMMHTKLPWPGDNLEGMGYGMSPLSPEAYSVDVDNSATIFLKELFDRGLMPNIAFTFEELLDDPTVGHIRERIKEIYGGSDRWIEPVILQGGGDVKTLSQNFSELGFESIDERNESRILGPFGVPPILIGTRVGLTRSSYGQAYEQARKACWEDTLVPELNSFLREFQYYLRVPGQWVDYDFSKVPALQANVNESVVSFVSLVGTGVSKNAAARITNIDIGDVPDGDVVYMPLSLIPVGSTAPKLPAGGDEPEATDDDRKFFRLVKAMAEGDYDTMAALKQWLYALDDQMLDDLQNRSIGTLKKKPTFPAL